MDFILEKFASRPKNYYNVRRQVETEKQKGNHKIGIVTMEVQNGQTIWTVAGPPKLVAQMKEAEEENHFLTAEAAVARIYEFRRPFVRQKPFTQQDAFRAMPIPETSPLYGHTPRRI